MKFFLLLLALMPLAMGLSIQAISDDAKTRSLSSQAVDFIEAFKEQMPCGIPSLGIPPLAPFNISHKEFNISTKFLKAYGEIDKFRLDGLDNFDIVELKINAVLSKVTFKFNWNHIYLQTDYKMSTSLDNFRMQRSGNAKMALQDLTVWGVVKYSLGVVSGNLRLKSFDLYMSLDKVTSDIEGLSKWTIINKKLNQFIEEWIMLAINDNTENFSYFTNGYVVPLANDRIGDMSLSDLLRLIGGGAGGGGAGGGGGEGEGEGEKVPCVPEENKDEF